VIKRFDHGSAQPCVVEFSARPTSSLRLTYVAFHPDLAAPGSVDAIAELTALAGTAGVRHLVLLSGRGEEAAQPAERLVQSSGLGWTMVRAAWFAQNFTEGNFADDVAVAALTDDRHLGQVYEVTGPRLLTFADAVAALGAETGRDVRFVSVSMDAYAATLAEYQVASELVGLLRYLFNSVLDGRNASVADGVQRALGRPPRDFTDFAHDIAHALGRR
jgi:uncharacterized protein YbjT (DUF2867 family)